MASSVPVLVKRHVFGINNRFNDNIHFLDSHTFIYIAGRNIVFYNIEEHSQRFVIGSSPSSEHWISDPEICSIALSPNSKYLAIAERAEQPTIKILDSQSLRKKQKLVIPPKVASKSICSMSFTANSNFLAIQCGSPDWKLCIFDWQKALMTHCITTSSDLTPIHQISYCPNSPLIAVCHQDSVQIHQQQDKECKEESIEIYPYESESTWTCLCWIDDTLFCGNSGGDVIVVKDNKFQEVILSKNDNIAITAIQCINSSILAIGASDCTVSFLQKSIEHGIASWNVMCCINLCIGYTVKDNDNKLFKSIPFGMSVDPSERTLLITTKNKQIYSVNISNLVTAAPQNSESDLINSGNTNNLNESIQKTISQPLGHFHFEGINGMDICIRKPWIVSCSNDKSICIWNYLTRKLEICKYFNNKIYSVAFHPSGLHILAGFEDKLKLLNVLMDDIQPYKDFHIVRACRECKFSNGGHIFAAVNGDKIHIYNTYSGELISILRGHNQKIRSLYFSLDDSSLISAGAEGAVYEWSMFNFNRIQEFVNRQCPLNTAIITKDNKIYCTGNTPLLNEIVGSQLEKEVDIGGMEMTRLIISHLPQRMIFASTVNGFIRSMKFPLTTDHLDYVGHLGKIERMVISEDDVYLFSCGQDGCINIYEIRDKEGRFSGNASSASNESLAVMENLNRNEWSTEILVTTSYLYEKKQLLVELANKVEELRLHNDYQLRLREMHYQDTLKEKAEKFNRELSQQKLKYQVLKDEQQDMEMEYEEKIKLKEDQHCKQVQELESFYQSQLMSEIEKYHELDIELNDKQNEWEQQTLNKKDSHQTSISNMRNSFNDKLNLEIAKKNKLNDEHQNLLRDYNETKQQLLEDFDMEIEEMNEKYLTILNEERESTLRLKGENGVMKKKFASLQNEIEDQIEESKKMATQENNFRKTIVSLKQEIEKLDDAMLSRDNIIGEKEKKIYKLKKKNQNLEKHKFVLDYKIKSLKKQIEPRQNKIMSMKDNVKKLDVELETLHKRNGQLKVAIKQTNQSINAVQKVINGKKEKYKKLQLITSKFGYDLSQIIQYIQSPKELRQYFVNTMYDKNKQNSLMVFVDQNYDINKNVLKEYSRQRQHLVLCVNSLKKKLGKQSKVNRKENYQIMMQNVKYMTEIQELRKELKSLTAISADQRSSKMMNDGNKSNNTQSQILQSQKTQIQELRESIQTLHDIQQD